MKITVNIHEAEEGGFWAEVPAFPGCFSEGDTLDEVRANIKEAAEAWIEVVNEMSSRPSGGVPCVPKTAPGLVEAPSEQEDPSGLFEEIEL